MCPFERECTEYPISPLHFHFLSEKSDLEIPPANLLEVCLSREHLPATHFAFRATTLGHTYFHLHISRVLEAQRLPCLGNLCLQEARSRAFPAM